MTIFASFLRGRRIWNPFKNIEVRGIPVTSDDFGRRLALRGRYSTWNVSGSFCVAGAVLGASQVYFAWRVQYLVFCMSFCVAV